jgi:glutamate/aspartate transport system substrate-binding protein
MKRPGAAACLYFAAVWVVCANPLADESAPLTGTLKTISDRGTILIGYRDSSVPFSFLNRAGQPVGLSLEICHGIAEDVAHSLNRDLLEPDAPVWQMGIRITFVPVTADQRLPKVISGEVDLECGSTTANAERAKLVAFSPVFFVSGTKLTVPLQGKGRARISSCRDLARRTVVVSAGTTNAEVMQRLASRVSPEIKVVEMPSLEPAYDRLVAGKADAFASDDVLLAGLLASHHDSRSFDIVGDYLPFEPYAITLRRNDPAFADLIKDTFARMASEGMLSRLYTRWLMGRLPTGERLAIPMSPYLTEMYRALGQPD